MTAILTNNFKLQVANLFKDFFEVSVSKNMYIGIGKSIPWTDELNPDVPADTVTELGDANSTLIGLKKVTVSDVANVIPRFDWTNTTRFVAYNNLDSSLFKHPTSAEVTAAGIGGYTASSFYCMTDEYNVYKCLKAPAANSTVKPTGKLLTPFTTADGYVWKYLYTVSSSDIDKYLTNAWLPVKTLLADDGSDQWDVQNSTTGGTIDNILIGNDGSTYSKFFSGTAAAISSNTITFPSDHSSGGSINLVGESVYIVSATTGAGQFLKISSYNSGTKVASLTGSFSPTPTGTVVYNIVPSIVVDGDGTGFSGCARITSDNVVDTVISANGSGYSFANITLSSGTGYTLTAVISPTAGHGADAVSELGGSYIMISSQLEYADTHLINDNDYRRILLIKDVLSAASAIATAPSLNALKSITISNIGGPNAFEQDEIVQTSGGAKFIIVSIDTINSKLYYIQNSVTGISSFTNAETITGLTSGGTADIDTLNASEITNGSGEIFYIKHLRPILRSPSLNEDIRILIQF